MRTVHQLTAVLVGTVGWACASQPAPVPVMARTADLTQLSGEWSGYYDSQALERRGTIVFNLKAGSDTARDDVTMIPRGWTRPLGPADDPVSAARQAPIPEVLRIRFVRVEGGKVSGTLQPYRDPDCGCRVYTTFEGEVQEDVIEGTFVARHADGPLFRGTWLVMRRKSGG